MADNYQRGDLLPCRWQQFAGQPPAATGPVFTFDVTGYEFDDLCLSLNVSSTRHQGRTARIGGQGDSKGNLTFKFDLDLAPYLTPPAIKPGTLGFLQPMVSTDLTSFFGIGVLVVKVHYASKLTDALEWNFDWEESVLAGPFTYPRGTQGVTGPNPGGNPQGNP